MGLDHKSPRLIGNLIRTRREALGLSQRALGLLFTPAVTTQFISNIERGVTPLPPTHVPTLAKALLVSEGEIMSLLEREYTQKLSDRLGRPAGELNASGNGDDPDHHAIVDILDRVKSADPKTRQAFFAAAQSVLGSQKIN